MRELFPQRWIRSTISGNRSNAGKHVGHDVAGIFHRRGEPLPRIGQRFEPLLGLDEVEIELDALKIGKSRVGCLADALDAGYSFLLALEDDLDDVLSDISLVVCLGSRYL
jgi:hypothetical protein